MNTLSRVLTLLLIAAPGGAAAAHAQTAGATLLVEARDPAGAAMPGVLVTVASAETGLERAGVTVDDGTVWLVRLPAGTYTLTAVRGGFKTEVIQKIHVEAAARGKINVVLKPGDYTEQVVVEAGCDDAAHRQQRGRRGLRQRDAAGPAGRQPRSAGIRRAGARDGAARAGLAALDPGEHRRQQRRGARGLEQLPARRRRQQRSVPQPPRHQPEPRRHPGVRAPPEHVRRGVRAQRGGAAQHGAEVRLANAARVNLRVLPSLRARCLESARQGRRQAFEPASSVRRHAGRPAAAAAILLLRERRRHRRPRGGHTAGPRADHARARGRFQRVRCRDSRSADRPAVSRRRDPRVADQSAGRGVSSAVSGA